ncbi:OmpA family protein [Flavobacterium sp. RHBU_24]|uniref:OmpA family protein n=1 Tax=Flavobacterium sp. RHBU_24 TaxID=3391185 RepID=UPI0039852893
MKQIFAILFTFISVFTVKAQEQFSVYFETNKHELTAKEQARLDGWIAANAKSKILAINGYTDEDGTVTHNDDLSNRRVDFVFSKVKGKVKIREDFYTRSFGELHRQSTVKSENRKATVYYLQEKDLAKENEILGIKDEPVANRPKPKVIYPDKIMVRTPAGEKEIQLDTLFMEKLGTAKTGDKVRIPNLNFVENTFAVMEESRPRLYELLEVMKANPNLKIKLQGHVCCMTADRKNLSTQRAKAVMEFLNRSGIEKGRLSFEGFGVSQPLYTIPEKTADEREANRRVEVLIVAN